MSGGRKRERESSSWGDERNDLKNQQQYELLRLLQLQHKHLQQLQKLSSAQVMNSSTSSALSQPSLGQPQQQQPQQQENTTTLLNSEGEGKERNWDGLAPTPLLSDPSNSAGVKVLPASFQPGSWDVICQRGRENYDHVGNQRFRSLVQQYYEKYSRANSKIEKSNVVSEIVALIRSNSNGGGFVKKDLLSSRWLDVGDKLARDKVGQALRDGITMKANGSPSFGSNPKVALVASEDQRNRVSSSRTVVPSADKTQNASTSIVESGVNEQGTPTSYLPSLQPQQQNLSSGHFSSMKQEPEQQEGSTLADKRMKTDIPWNHGMLVSSNQQQQQQQQFLNNDPTSFHPDNLSFMPVMQAQCEPMALFRSMYRQHNAQGIAPFLLEQKSNGVSGDIDESYQETRIGDLRVVREGATCGDDTTLQPFPSSGQQKQLPQAMMGPAHDWTTNGPMHTKSDSYKLVTDNHLSSQALQQPFPSNFFNCMTSWQTEIEGPAMPSNVCGDWPAMTPTSGEWPVIPSNVGENHRSQLEYQRFQLQQQLIALQQHEQGQQRQRNDGLQQRSVQQPSSSRGQHGSAVQQFHQFHQFQANQDNNKTNNW